jgi:2-oxoglutarate dehydrogenase E2 component (dihydrolipoamide succinyltransferase)
MGESIAEGTIVRWIKKVGDRVDRDEPLFEISTDKVDAEIPSPAAGVLTEIKVKEGETVAVNAVVAMIGAEGEAPTAAEPPLPTEDPRRQRTSPLVRRIARDHSLDITSVSGSGIGGRVTKHDILEFIDKHPASAPAPARPLRAEAALPPAMFKPGERVEVQPLSAMRRKIAEHMVLSRRTAAHVHSVFHVNFSTVERLRQQHKAEYEAVGAKLTYLAFIAKAVVDAIRRYPVINASLDGDNVVYKKDVNLGIAVALEGGLIVPVVKNADERNLLGLSRAIADVAERARARQLTPDEVHGGTFTLTNPGVLGAQFGMPIINQPQVAILGVGTIEKRAVVVDDAIAIRTMGYLTLGFDHRLVDGAVADQFMSDVKQQLEQFDPHQV